MSLFEFRKALIDEHIENIGIDVGPPIEVRIERTKLYDYGAWLTDEWPSLYENIVQGPASFHISKNFVFPGKGGLEFTTFLLTNRGPVFVFPKKFGVWGEEPQLPESGDLVVKALRKFKEFWPQCKQIRLGKVSTYIFDCGTVSPIDVLSERFIKITVPPNGEIKLRINRPDDDYNRIIELEPILKLALKPTGAKEIVGNGLKVVVDFNNRDMTDELTDERKNWILRQADEFCRAGLFEFLNGGD